MKRMRKLFSVLLSAALVAQVGVVIGMGSGVTTGAHTAANHGPEREMVSNATGCTAPVHWLTGKSMSGWTGWNYYYPTADSEEILCYTGNEAKTSNVIVLPSNVIGGKLSVTGFKNAGLGDVIYIPGVYECRYDKESGELLIAGTEIEYTIYFDEFDSTHPATLSIQKLPDVPKTFTLEMTTSNNIVTATPKPANGNYLYLWERKQNSDSAFSVIQAKTENSIEVDQKTPDLWTYRCTVIDEAGQVLKSETTKVVVGCHVTPQLGEIMVESDKQLNGATLETAEPKTYTLTVKETYDDSNCGVNGHKESNHGYRVEWKITEGGDKVTFADEELRLDPEKMSETGDTVKISAVLVNGNKESPAVTAQFTVKKPTPTKPDEGETSETKPDPNKPDPSTGDGDNGDNNTGDNGDDKNPNNGGTGTEGTDKPTPKPTTDPEPSCAKEPTAVTIIGADRINEKSGPTIQYQAKIDFDGDAACDLPDHQSGKVTNHGYTVAWSLNGGTGYASVNGATGEVTITPANLPTTETKLTLTATLSKARTVAKTAMTMATREIAFVLSTVFDCKGAIQITANDNYISFTDGDAKNGLWEKTKEFTGRVTVFSEHCTAGHAHTKLQWSTDQSWVTLDSEETDINGKVTLKVNYRHIPSMENEVKVTATVKDTKISDTFILRINRPEMCQTTVSKVTISGIPSFTIAANRSAKYTYTAVKTYEGDICDMAGHIDAKSHGEAPTQWTIENDYKKAFDLGTDGTLIVNGSRLEEGKSYPVTISATADGKTDHYSVVVTCTAPVVSGSDNSSSDKEWESLYDKLDDAGKGDTVKVNLGGDADVPFYIFDAIRGRNVDLEMKVNGGYTWTVNGKSVKKFPGYQIYIPLDVESYKNSKMEKLCRDSDVRAFRLKHEGNFFADMKLTMDLGQGRASKVLYLYSYDEDQNRLTYCSSAKADGYGNVSFVLTRSLGAYVVTNKALYGENPVTSGGGAVSGSGNITAIYPPVAPATSAQAPSSGSAASESSDSESSSEESAAPLPATSVSEPPVQPTDTPVKAENNTLPVLVPILVLCIAGVITATALIVRGSRGKMGPVVD